MLRTLVTTTDVDSTEKVYSIAGKKPQHAAWATHPVNL